jgi:16S rRNA A1518/A1519 N6-dimethyltransferase RsmA/KsgA/DIM1 with predicted DNA glycosylase/AP lyase activity
MLSIILIYSDSKALEIGSGTGEATLPILKTGCNIII